MNYKQIIKKLSVSLLFLLVFSIPQIHAAKLNSGKWIINDNDTLVSSTVFYTFIDENNFLLDSSFVKYYGKYSVSGSQIQFSYTHKVVADVNNTAIKDTIPLNYTTYGTITDDEHFVAAGSEYRHVNGALFGLMKFISFSGFLHITIQHGIMLLVGLFFIFLGIQYNYEPLLLVPIGFGILVGNVPFLQGSDLNLQIGIYEQGSVLNYLYFGVLKGIYPPLIFLGIGAMTDFSTLLSNPRLMLLGAASQVGIFLTVIGALLLGFTSQEAGAIGIIGGADGPTAIFLSSRLAPHLIGPIAIAAYSYMALVPVIQPPIMRLMTTKKERLIRMRPPRQVSKQERIIFPIVGMLLTCFIAPFAIPLLGMLFFGNLLKESTVTKRLSDAAANPIINIVTILLGLTVGASTQADVFLTTDSILIFGLGAFSFMVATAGGLFFAKVMNWMSSKDNPINPLIGAAGVSAVPDSARVVHHEGEKNDPSNYLLMHAMAPNVSGVIGSAVAAGILMSFLM